MVLVSCCADDRECNNALEDRDFPCLQHDLDTRSGEPRKDAPDGESVTCSAPSSSRAGSGGYESSPRLYCPFPALTPLLRSWTLWGRHTTVQYVVCLPSLARVVCTAPRLAGVPRCHSKKYLLSLVVLCIRLYTQRGKKKPPKNPQKTKRMLQSSFD